MNANPPTGTPEWVELSAIFDRWVSWHRRWRALRWGLRGLGAGLALALIAGLLLVFQHRVIARELAWGAAGIALGGLALGALAGLFWPVEQVRLARGFDRAFGLHERVSTALELHDKEPLDDTAADWRARQLADTLAAARPVEPARNRPVRLERFPLAAAGIALLALAVLGYLGRPAFQAAEHERQVTQAIQTEREDLEALAEQIQASPDLSQAEKDSLTAPLKEAIEKLSESRSPEQALAALQQAGDQVRAVGEAADQGRQQAMQQAGQTLQQSGSAALGAVGQALQNGDAATAGSLLSQIDPNQLSAAQRQALDQALAQAGVDPSQAATGAGNSLQQAGQALAQTGQPGAQSQAAQQAAGQVGQGQAALSQAAGQGSQMAANPGGTPAGGSQGTGGQSGTGNSGTSGGQGGSSGGQGQGAAGNQGQAGSGSSQGTGQGSSGGGAGRGSSNGQEGQGGAAGQGQIGQQNGPGDGGENPYDPVYAPENLGGSGGATVDLPGSGQPGSQVTGQQPSVSGNPGDARVPYVDALPGYSTAYRQAMENGEVPAYLLPLVRQYFSSLQP